MLKGVYFKTLPSENLLYQILKPIDVKEYCWYNVEEQNEVWDENISDLFFKENVYDGETFSRQIASNNFIVFLKLQAYFEKGSFSNINTYEEFQKSNCQMILLIYDCECVEIYSKDQMMLKSIYDQAILNNYTEVKFIDEKNFFRTTMNIL